MSVEQELSNIVQETRSLQRQGTVDTAISRARQSVSHFVSKTAKKFKDATFGAVSFYYIIRLIGIIITLFMSFISGLYCMGQFVVLKNLNLFCNETYTKEQVYQHSQQIDSPYGFFTYFLFPLFYVYVYGCVLLFFFVTFCVFCT